MKFRCRETAECAASPALRRGIVKMLEHKIPLLFSVAAPEDGRTPVQESRAGNSKVGCYLLADWVRTRPLEGAVAGLLQPLRPWTRAMTFAAPLSGMGEL